MGWMTVPQDRKTARAARAMGRLGLVRTLVQKLLSVLFKLLSSNRQVVPSTST